MRQYNTKSAKLTGEQVRAMYEELCEGATQSSMARKYGLSVIQVGRIARGESRARETGAYETPIPNFNFEPRPDDVEASLARLKGKLATDESVGKPSLYQSPPGYEQIELSDALAARIAGELGRVKPSVDGELKDFLSDGEEKE